MPIDPHARRLLDMLLAAPARGPLDATERRRRLEALLTLGGIPTPIGAVIDRIAEAPHGPIPLRHYRPVEPAFDPLGKPSAAALVYCHSGGFIAGDLQSHDGFCRTLANAAGCSVIAVGYRRAPEDPFPAAIDDCCAATEWIFRHANELHLDPQRIGLAGDSAGGNLAAAASLTLAARHEIRLLLLLCPILDCSNDSRSRRLYGTGHLLEMGMFREELAAYLRAEEDPRDERISPLLARDLSGLPPSFIHTAEYDPMRDEGEAFARRLASAGVAVAHTCHDGMIHLFYALPRLIPYARSALVAIAAELAPRLHGELT